MKTNFLDKAIAYINPGAAIKRVRSRMALDVVERNYEAAARGRRTKDWKASGASSNMEIHTALTVLRNRSRNMVRNNPSAKNAVRVIPNNVVGTGILPTPKIAGKNAKKINDAIKSAWKLWADKTGCDYDSRLNLYGIQHLVMKSIAESGECLIRRVYTDAKEKIPLKIQVLEGDFIDTYKHDLVFDKDGERNYYGIRFSKKGKRIGYWIYTSHPVEYGQLESKLIPSDDIIHLYEVERPGQIRGIPFSSASMLRMKDLDDYEDAELIRQKIAACFTVFITEDAEEPGTDKKEDTLEKVEPGIIEHLTPGKSVTVAQPPVTTGYDAYTRSVQRNIAAGIGITYEAMTGDLSNVNFSSGRMGWLEFQRNVNHWQWNIMVPVFCETVYEWFLVAAGLKGIVPLGIEVPVTWTPPRREMIDPVKETEAMNQAVRSGFNTWSNTVKELGQDPDEVMEELKTETKLFSEAGLKPESNPVFDNPSSAGKKKKQPEAAPQ